MSFQDHDPHAFLGLHDLDDGAKAIRLWRPDWQDVYLEVGGEIVKAKPTKIPDLFEYRVSKKTTWRSYRIYHRNGKLAHDPYSFTPTFGEVDAFLFNKGVHYELYNVMGGRVCTHEECSGVKFSVWAPEARKVSLIGDFNGWDGRLFPMRSMGASGVWELFIPGLEEYEKYKFEIHGKDGVLRVKTDPYGLCYELRPSTASVVFDVDRYSWKHQNKKRVQDGSPMNIYEVHLGSWKKNGADFLNYREIAPLLVNYCLEMHFSHVELMPIAEHPLDESWGYQVTGFYGATSRYGTPEDFQFFVDCLHGAGIGVILDWVPAHFPADDFALAQFDGSYLYEHADPKQGYHPHWNTYIFNYGRREVSNFLIANALFWLEKMKVDGLRVDAVASMLYLDYGRKEGEWIPNAYGGRENLEAIEFIKHLTSVVHQRFPEALLCAEESTSFPKVSHHLQDGGLGFDRKWNMGWMNDTLAYFHKDSLFRHHHHDLLTFGLLYAFTERFILVLSHDEVVHGKGSLIGKMPGDYWQKFANVRLLYSYMMCQPGKKLLFMSGELGQWDEWNCKQEIQWHLLNFSFHKGLKQAVSDMNATYHTFPALWERDFQSDGFQWIDFSDIDNSVISYLRKGAEQFLLVIHHFTPIFFSEYRITLPKLHFIREVFNSDREEYGGSGKINPSIVLDDMGFAIQLPPLATMIFEVRFE